MRTIYQIKEEIEEKESEIEDLENDLYHLYKELKIAQSQITIDLEKLDWYGIAFDIINFQKKYTEEEAEYIQMNFEKCPIHLQEKIKPILE